MSEYLNNCLVLFKDTYSINLVPPYPCAMAVHKETYSIKDFKIQARIIATTTKICPKACRSTISYE
jgi:hypothetical protein